MPRKAKLFSDPEYLAVFEELAKIAKPEQTAVPFIPLIPNDWSTADGMKVMWCGGATNGWGEKNHPEVFCLKMQNEDNERWLNSTFSTRNSTPFWKRQEKLLPLLGLSPQKTIWNNIYKIGGLEESNRGMPKYELQDFQAEFCVRAFNIELNLLVPDLVVLHVGELIEKIWNEIAGPWDDWNVYRDGESAIAACKLHKGVKFIWLSRRYATDIVYRDAFKWCLKELKIEGI